MKNNIDNNWYYKVDIEDSYCENDDTYEGFVKHENSYIYSDEIFNEERNGLYGDAVSEIVLENVIDADGNLLKLPADNEDVCWRASANLVKDAVVPQAVKDKAQLIKKLEIKNRYNKIYENCNVL